MFSSWGRATFNWRQSSTVATCWVWGPYELHTICVVFPDLLRRIHIRITNFRYNLFYSQRVTLVDSILRLIAPNDPRAHHWKLVKRFLLTLGPSWRQKNSTRSLKVGFWRLNEEANGSFVAFSQESALKSGSCKGDGGSVHRRICQSFIVLAVGTSWFWYR